MDDIDRARRTTDRMLAVQLANQVGKGRYQGESLHQCEECDDPIPEARRRHIPGVRLCVPCKTRLERLGR
ncbi:TraR/DksA family transcriptional regulator [Aeromonas hydrophila]|uniref:TraR/DksA family transcriptional regulator n=1 Tax=Aeromonas hydrophila TaxID=644 RepID=UPI001C797694|nr:TraR/DksA family transcriptional regulator [Aeromonas hydrophila]QWL72363.1 TraR/DksA family transcriptional regulator [Aeromonas hydrophila]